jgi:UDP-glucose 4-epimerase
MASRGSVIPLFHEQLHSNSPITITEPEMTRFMMSLEDAVDLVIYAFNHGISGDIFVQKSPASTILDLALALKKIYFNSKSEIQIIGARHAEKLYETLVAKEELFNAIDLGGYFRIPSDNRDLNYNKYFNMGQGKLTNLEEYNSHNTNRLSIDDLIFLLNKIGYVKDNS